MDDDGDNGSDAKQIREDGLDSEELEIGADVPEMRVALKEVQRLRLPFEYLCTPLYKSGFVAMQI